jgi:hypothetical protein
VSEEEHLSHNSAEPSNPISLVARQGHEAPSAIAADGWRFHHVGIPTQTPRPGEQHVPHLKIHVAGFESSPYGIQWMRFDPDAPYPEIIKTVPHVAFAVDDLAAALEGREILVPPNSPSEGVMVAMILDNGAPVELLEFATNRKESLKEGHPER